jgi:intracellular sulfur oxidation DsrE/DsrF family protein
MLPGRRSFLRWTLGGVAGLAVTAASRPDDASVTPDDPWLAAIASRPHKAIMDVMHFFPDGTPFRRAKALLTVLRESYGVAGRDVGLAVGFHSAGLAQLMREEAWADLGLMAWLAPQLNGAGAAALRAGAAGTFAKAGADGVRELRALGVHVLACRQTVGGWAQRVATQKGETVDAVRERILRGLHEGVEPVPAMIAAVVLGQERGARYVAVA